MKKMIAMLLLTASLLSLASCSSTASKTTAPGTGEPPPVTTAQPPETTLPPVTDPPAPELSDEERVLLLLSELTALSELSFAGELSLTVPENSASGAAEDTYAVTGSLSQGGFSADGMKNGVLPFSVNLSETTLTYTEGGVTVSYTAAELLSEIPDLRANLDRADRALASLVHYLTVYGAVIDTRLSEQGIAASSADLLSAVDLLIGVFHSLAAEAGYTPTVTPSGSEGDLLKLAAQLVTVLMSDAGGYTVSFDLNPLVGVLRETISDASEKIDQTVSALIDSVFGQGTASDLLWRLSLISGSEKLSVLTAEIQKIILAAGMTMDDFYAIVSALISENLTAGVTAAELEAILRENRNKSIDSLIARFAPDQTYDSVIQMIASLLTKTPAQLYSEWIADGSPSEPTLADCLSRLDAFLADADKTVSLSLSVDSSRDMKPLSISLTFSFLSDALRTSLSLSATPAEN